MDKTLTAAAAAGQLVLTVNDRLSRHLAQEYDRAQQRQGRPAWLRPAILSLSAWLNRCQGQLPGMPLFLNQAQLQHVWERIVAADVESTGNQLLQVPQTARRALQAHQLLIKYAARFGVNEAAEDHRAFLRWRQAWQSAASEHGWHDPAEAPWLLAEAISQGLVRLPEQILFAGFDETAPDLLNLREAIQKRGTSILDWQPPAYPNARRLRVAAADAVDEVSRCARWARALLTVNPTARIGVVAPQLEAYRELVEQVFTAELEPERLLAGDEVPHLFNLSLGRKLDRVGVVAAALKLLRLALRVDQSEICWLLCTPYLGKAAVEAAARAQLDRELRRLRRFEWPLPRLAATLRTFAEKYAIAAPGLVEVVTILATDLKRSSHQLPGYWAEHFTTFLQKLGWPGDRGLSSGEYQAVQHFRKALAELASLDGVSTAMSRSAAAALLARMIGNTEFQPEGAGGPVQVLGELESSGMTFDHLWVLGLHDAALPRHPGPNPFIPLTIQRRHRMKRADAEREQHFAAQVAARLFAAAPDIVLSWPVRGNTAEQRPSPFLNGIADGQPLQAESNSPDRLLWQARPALEELIDDQGPPISTRKPFTGGTGILKDQALCPFRAFAHHRLRAERLDAPEIGIDNMSRGTLVHTVLELFWAQVVDQDALLSLDQPSLAKLLGDAAEGALDRLERELRCDLPHRQRQIEHQRLVSVTRQWLEFERRRGSFRVMAAEKNRQVQLGSLAIRTRIDRIDELDDGTCAIIDYKTGRADPLQWLDQRITEPQLPAYCLGLPHASVGAVMFAVVRSKEKESGFSGLARDSAAWPGAKSRALAAGLEEKGWSGFDEVLAHWEKTLPALGDAFTRGDAAVDPVDPELACKYCDLKGLCRILEQAGVVQEAQGD